MIKNLKRLGRFIAAILIIVGSLSLLPSKKVEDISNITYDEIIELRPNIIIGSYSLYSPDHFIKGISLYEAMIQRASAMKIFNIKPYAKQTFRLYINSSGGRVDVALEAIKYFHASKKFLNIEFTCYINKAMSAAFTLAMSICDKRIGLRNVSIMTSGDNGDL